MKNNKAKIIVEEILNNGNINYQKMKPSKFVIEVYRKYKKNYLNNNTLNGRVFEEIIIQCLLVNDIQPVYTQVKMSFVPNVIFDIVIYNRHTPIILSVKTSLRERWKQADLEAVALKYVYRNAEVYLINNSFKESEVRKRDSNRYMGIDEFIYVGSTEFDKVINRIKQINIQYFEKIPVFYAYTEHYL